GGGGGGIGIAWGTAIRTDGDLFGHSVNLAKRLSDTAKGGQIVASSDVFGQAASLGFRFRDLGDRELKGIGSERLYEVVWREEVARLDATDDSVNLVLTGDDKLVIEFAKPMQEEVDRIRAELDGLGKEARGLGGVIQRAVGRRVSHALPKLVDWATARAGMGIEHPLADIDARMRLGKLEILVNGKKRLEFGGDQVSPANARQFLERLRALRADAG
ncbi:hypothetical protein KJ567_06215, partial [Candidatus Bipolaricaulota bacterium]|nr:hypothetical protein [Candidatus Bipolaricaulota bacterium]